MVTCEFKTNSEAQSNEIMDKIGEAIQHWMEQDRDGLILCQWCDKEGNHVSLSAESSVDIMISLCYESLTMNLEYVKLVLMYAGDLKKIIIPADVEARIFCEKTAPNTEKDDTFDKEPSKESDDTQKMFDSILEDYEHISNNGGYVSGLSTGYYDLDYRTRGFQKGQLILLAGRKWVGKTNFALNIAHYAIKKEKAAVAIFSAELSGAQITRRLMVLDMNKPLEKVLYGSDRSGAKEILESSANMFKDSLLYLDEDQDITTKKILNKCTELKKESGLGLVIIDGMFLSSDSQDYKFIVLKRLKEIAKQIFCPILVISDISSKEEGGWNECMDIDGIPDWDYYNRVADVKMLFQTVPSRSRDENAGNEIEIVVNSLREGRIGKVRLSEDPEIIKFKNLGVC